MIDDTNTGGTYNSPKSIGQTGPDIVKRWSLELDIAEKNEKDWLKSAGETLDRYRGKEKKKNSYNVLWSNTETLRQAIYNTLPKPDVRRRFRDDDPTGKVVSQVLERCAEYAMDTYDFDHVLKLDLMDMLLPGRGISRIKYIPDLEDMEADEEQSDEQQEPMQQIVYESVECEHVQYDDFRCGPGKTWDEVRWVAFGHRFSQDAGVEKFGEVFEEVPLDDVADDRVKRETSNISKLFKTARVWEVWGKDTKEVLFIATRYKHGPLYPLDNPEGIDPLGIDGFFPIPRPLYAIEDPASLVPLSLFEQYKEQADELDTISSRINALTKALKLRGVYNSVISELKELETAKDNELIAATNIAALIEAGGLEKHIMYMPIQQAAEVIKFLLEQREAAKQVIYELTGISDIMRGATNAQETMGAQQIKSQWGTQRLKKMQAEFQRYARDLIRLKCQVIANKFQPETLKKMTGLVFADTNMQKQQIKQQADAFARFQKLQAQQQPQGPQGAPPGPPQGQPMGAPA